LQLPSATPASVLEVTHVQHGVMSVQEAPCTEPLPPYTTCSDEATGRAVSAFRRWEMEPSAAVTAMLQSATLFTPNQAGATGDTEKSSKAHVSTELG